MAAAARKLDGDAAPRGGRRVGAGRPPLLKEPMRRRNIVIPDGIYAYLQKLGGGNASAGVRRLVMLHGEQDGPHKGRREGELHIWPKKKSSRTGSSST